MDIYTANKLLQLRKKNNYSQEELAQHLNISRQAVSKWERAESSPDTDNLIALAKLYRISLDELLEINVKTFVCEDNNNYERKIISLKKEEAFSPDNEINQILSSRSVSIKDEIYPQSVCQPDNEEIYPQFDNSLFQTQSIKSDTVNLFNAENYKVPQQEDNFKSTVQNFSSLNNHNVTVIPKKKKGFSKFIDNINNINNFKLLYLFPYYALAAIMFFIGLESGEHFNFRIRYVTSLSDISYLWFLTIPLYYTGVVALQKKNMNWFCYPILAVILFLILLHSTGSPASLIAFATIPFYYFFVAVKKYKKKK